MIGAKEARQLNPEHVVSKQLEQLERLIIEAAEAGYTRVRVPYNLCDTNGYAIAFTHSQVEHDLLSLGYKITSHNEARQFVDVWLEVSWDEDET